MMPERVVAIELRKRRVMKSLARTGQRCHCSVSDHAQRVNSDFQASSFQSCCSISERFAIQLRNMLLQSPLPSRCPSPSKTSGGSGRIRASPSGTSLHSGSEHIKHVLQSKFDTSNWRCLCELVSEGTKTNIISSPMFRNPITTSVTLRPGRTVYVTQLILVVF
jgi:hypothetical protein